MKSDLNSLISQLTASSSDDEESDSTSAVSTDSDVAALQSKFSSLLDSLGASGSSVSLSDFLSAFASKVPDGGQERVGSLVDTTA